MVWIKGRQYHLRCVGPSAAELAQMYVELGYSMNLKFAATASGEFWIGALPGQG